MYKQINTTLFYSNYLDGEKNIKKVEFYYHTVGQEGDRKAHIELWGLKTNPNKNRE